MWMAAEANSKCTYTHLKPFCTPGLLSSYILFPNFWGNRQEYGKLIFFFPFAMLLAVITQEIFGGLRETQVLAKPQIKCYY